MRAVAVHGQNLQFTSRTAFWFVNRRIWSTGPHCGGRHPQRGTPFAVGESSSDRLRLWAGRRRYHPWLVPPIPFHSRGSP